MPVFGSSIAASNSTPSEAIPSPSALPPTPPLPSGSVAHPGSGDGCTVKCSSGFYCTANSTCNPDCGSFEQDSHSAAVTGDVVIVISACIGVLAGTAVLIVSGKRRKQL